LAPWPSSGSRKREPEPTSQSGYPFVPDPGTDDAALVAAARANRQAFTFLYDRHVARIYAYCYLKLGSREAAEDATSEVFFQAMRDLGSFRGGVFAAWLFRIAQHTVTDAQRRNRRGRAALPLDLAGELETPEQRLDERVADDSELEELRVALRQLPADQRAVLELQLAGLEPREIATTLRRSLNAVRHLRFRAFRQLRGALADPRPELEADRGGRR
jgi:RNA polymerase sigma-70 factor (ECF subfamily)